MSHKGNVVEYLKHRQWKRKNRGLGEVDDWYVDTKFLKSFDGIYFCKWCGQPMHAVEYDRVMAEIIMSCDKPFCPGNYTYGPRPHKMPNWKDYKIDEMTNQSFMNERGE